MPPHSQALAPALPHACNWASKAARPSAPLAASAPSKKKRAAPAASAIDSCRTTGPAEVHDAGGVNNEVDNEMDGPDEEETEDLDKGDDDDDDADLLQRLIALQTFAGCWEFSAKLLKVCSVSVTAKVPDGVDPKVFATILAVQSLEMKLGKEKEAWEMVADKAVAWIEAQRVDGGNEGEAGE